MKHVAVVPVFDDSRDGLDHASRIASSVIAVGCGVLPADCEVPLIAVDGSWNEAVLRVIDALKRHERPDRITLVLPESLAPLFADSGVFVYSW